jgi:hypothetical protein
MNLEVRCERDPECVSEMPDTEDVCQAMKEESDDLVALVTAHLVRVHASRHAPSPPPSDIHHQINKSGGYNRLYRTLVFEVLLVLI